MLASISKTVMAVAVMQAVEDGLLDLDSDVNDALPFDVRNPPTLGTAITLRMLLTHTSSIRDDWPTSCRSTRRATRRSPLGRYLRRYLGPGGDLYHTRAELLGVAPRRPLRVLQHRGGPCRLPGGGGLRHRRSTTGATRALRAARDDGHRVAPGRSHARSPCRTVPAGRFVPYGQYGYPDYPDGRSARAPAAGASPAGVHGRSASTRRARPSERHRRRDAARAVPRRRARPGADLVPVRAARDAADGAHRRRQRRGHADVLPSERRHRRDRARERQLARRSQLAAPTDRGAAVRGGRPSLLSRRGRSRSGSGVR